MRTIFFAKCTSKKSSQVHIHQVAAKSSQAIQKCFVFAMRGTHYRYPKGVLHLDSILTDRCLKLLFSVRGFLLTTSAWSRVVVVPSQIGANADERGIPLPNANVLRNYKLSARLSCQNITKTPSFWHKRGGSIDLERHYKKATTPNEGDFPCEMHLRKKNGQILLDNLVKTSRKPRRYRINMEISKFWTELIRKKGYQRQSKFPAICTSAENAHGIC